MNKRIIAAALVVGALGVAGCGGANLTVVVGG